MSESRLRSAAQRDTRLDRPDEGTVLLPALPHQPDPALLEIRLPTDVVSQHDEVLHCPRCDIPLSERCDLGWCQRCGYCRYMERRKIVPASVVRAQRQALLHAAGHRLLPAWLGVLLCGIFVCAVSAKVTWLNIGSDARTQHAWYVAQGTVAGLLMLMGHATAFLRLVPRGQRRTYAGLLVSWHLWWGVWRKLPATQASVWLVGWGLALALSIAAIYAGIESWIPSP